MTPTVQAPSLSNPSAGPVRRLAALLYDSLLILALSMAYGGLVIALRMLFLGSEDQPGEGAAVGGVWFQFGWAATIAAFYCLFWRRGGQTLGMRAWRLRLESDSDTGAPPQWRQCLLRCLVAPLALAAGGLGYWWCYIDSRGRSLHDRLSGTRVIVVPKVDS